MRIDCYLSERCGSFHELRENLDRALAELSLRAEVAWHTVDYDAAVRFGIPGSPTIRIDGSDLFGETGSPGVT